MEWHLTVSLEGSGQIQVRPKGCPRRGNWVAAAGCESWKLVDLGSESAFDTLVGLRFWNLAVWLRE